MYQAHTKHRARPSLDGYRNLSVQYLRKFVLILSQAPSVKKNFRTHLRQEVAPYAPATPRPGDYGLHIPSGCLPIHRSILHGKFQRWLWLKQY